MDEWKGSISQVILPTYLYIHHKHHISNKINIFQQTFVAHIDWSRGWKILKQKPSFFEGRSINLQVLSKTVPTQWLLWNNKKYMLTNYSQCLIVRGITLQKHNLRVMEPVPIMLDNNRYSGVLEIPINLHTNTSSSELKMSILSLKPLTLPFTSFTGLYYN
jgi:hypothetical protein